MACIVAPQSRRLGREHACKFWPEFAKVQHCSIQVLPEQPLRFPSLNLHVANNNCKEAPAAWVVDMCT
jgi:hypothetical protein